MITSLSNSAKQKFYLFTTKTTKSVLSIVEAVYLQNNKEVKTYYG